MPKKDHPPKKQLAKILEKGLTIHEISKKLKVEPYIIIQYIQKYEL